MNEKHDNLTETIDRLRGFDSRKLLQEMTDGLDEWHRHRAESTRNRRAYAATACVALLLIQASYLLAPVLPYHVSDGTNYEAMESLTYKLLEQ